MEGALNFLLDAIATGTVPPDPDELVATLNRVIASAARLHRSHTSALVRFAPVPEPALAADGAAEARIELARIVSLVSTSDKNLVVDTGLGYANREIADRQSSTTGAVRVRLWRLRLKLAA